MDFSKSDSLSKIPLNRLSIINSERRDDESLSGKNASIRVGQSETAISSGNNVAVNNGKRVLVRKHQYLSEAWELFWALS